jgi:hypothetical protein
MPGEALDGASSREEEACLVFPLKKSSPKRRHRELVEFSTMSYGSTLEIFIGNSEKNILAFPSLEFHLTSK